jgi:WD40 repeat protein
MINIHKKAVLTGHNAAVFAITATHEEQFILSGAGDGWVVRWDLANPELGHLVAKVDAQIFSLAQLDEPHKLVAGNMNGGIHWIDLEVPENTRNIQHHKKGVFAILNLGNEVFTLGGEGVITRWSAAEYRSVESIHLSNQSLRSIAYAAAQQELAIGASDGQIYILDALTFQLKKTIAQAHDNSVFSLCFTPDGQWLLSGSRDAHLKIWNTQTWELHYAQPAHWFTINAIAFHPDGLYFATGSRDKTIKIWDGHNFELLKVIDTIRHGGHVNSVNDLLWTRYHNELVSAGDDRSLMIWDIAAPTHSEQ